MNTTYALVTGGAGSIGLEIVKGLVKKNCTVFILDENAEALEEVEASYGDLIQTYVGDVSDSKCITTVAEDLRSKNIQLSHLVNTPALNLFTPFQDAKIEDIQKAIDITLMSYIYSIHSLWDLLAPGGSIVNISSVHSTTTKKGNSIYAIAKAGVDSLTRALAAELHEKDVRINAVAPGGFTSDFYKHANPNWKEALAAGQIFTSEDMANVALFLLSDEAKAVNGITLVADGGVSTVRANSSDW